MFFRNFCFSYFNYKIIKRNSYKRQNVCKHKKGSKKSRFTFDVQHLIFWIPKKNYKRTKTRHYNRVKNNRNYPRHYIYKRKLHSKVLCASDQQEYLIVHGILQLFYEQFDNLFLLALTIIFRR